MLERLIHFSIRHRWLMLVLTAALIALGVWSYRHLSIDAPRTSPTSRSRSIPKRRAIPRWKPSSG